MITLCIPTKDRPAFLARLLRYYARARFPHAICISDSSELEQAAENQRTVASLAGQLTLDYQFCPGLSSNAAAEQLSRRVATPYCALGADDDFLCPRGIDRCIAFLEDHSGYSAAHGVGLLLQVEGDQPYGSVGTVRRYPQAVLSAETGAARLKEFFTVSLKSLIFSVHRTETWQAMFRGLSAMQGMQNHNVFKDELISTCVSVIRGKVKEVDGLYLVRQMHSGIHRHPHVYDWITDPAWFPSYQTFCDRLIEELIRQDGLSAAAARAAVREGFWPYVAHCVTSDWEKDLAGRAPRRSSRGRALAARIPGLRRCWRAARTWVQQWQDALSLPALLRSSSPYHEDFRAVYGAVTSPPAAVSRRAEAQRPVRQPAVVEVGVHE